MTIYNLWKENFENKFPNIIVDEYLNFVSSHSVKRIVGATDHHHVLPKWAFPEFSNLSDHSWNGIHLLYSDHVKAHVILAKCWPVFQNTSVINRMYDDIQIDDDEFMAHLQSVIENDRLHRSQHQKEMIADGSHIFLQESFRVSTISRESEKYSTGVGNFTPEKIMEKYGVENVMYLPEILDKAMASKKQTLVQQYGVEHNWDMPGAREDMKEKYKQNFMKNHGVEHPNQLPESREKLRKQWVMNNPMSIEKHVESYKSTMMEKYGVDNPGKNPEIMKRIIQTRKELEANRPKKIWYKNIDTCQSVIVREGTDDEQLVLSLGFIKGRGIIGYTTTIIESLR